MKVTFEKDDIMKALSIYMLLQGYDTQGLFDFRWRETLTIDADVKPLDKEINLERIKKYANTRTF